MTAAGSTGKAELGGKAPIIGLIMALYQTMALGDCQDNEHGDVTFTSR